MQNSYILPVLVIFTILLAILRQEEDFQSLLDVASLIYISQLRGGSVKNVNIWVTLRPKFDHYAFEKRLEI